MHEVYVRGNVHWQEVCSVGECILKVQIFLICVGKCILRVQIFLICH